MGSVFGVGPISLVASQGHVHRSAAIGSDTINHDRWPRSNCYFGFLADTNVEHELWMQSRVKVKKKKIIVFKDNKEKFTEQWFLLKTIEVGAIENIVNVNFP